MSQEWRSRDPLEDQFFNHSRPDDQVNKMERVNEKVQKTREEIQSNSVDLTVQFIEILAKSNETRRKAERVEEEIRDQI